MKLFLSGFSFKIHFLQNHRVEKRPNTCRNLFFNYQAVVSWNYFATVLFSFLLRPICFLSNDTSQLKILCGYLEGKYCHYSSQRSLCYVAKKQSFVESLVVMLFEFLILLYAGPWQVSLICSIWFHSCNLSRAAHECVINEWFYRAFFFFLCVFRHTIELK